VTSKSRCVHRHARTKPNYTLCRGFPTTPLFRPSSPLEAPILRPPLLLLFRPRSPLLFAVRPLLPIPHSPFCVPHSAFPRYTHRSTWPSPPGTPEKFFHPLSPNDLQRFPPENTAHPRTFRCRVGRGCHPERNRHQRGSSPMNANPPNPRPHIPARHLRPWPAQHALRPRTSVPFPCRSILQPVNSLFSCEDFCLSGLIFNFPAVPLIGVHWCPFVVQIFPASHHVPPFLAFSVFFAVICPSLQTRDLTYSTFWLRLCRAKNSVVRSSLFRFRPFGPFGPYPGPYGTLPPRQEIPSNQENLWSKLRP
jgi:hypothetical protein